VVTTVADHVLNEADDGRVFRLAPGEAIEVGLPENATTGYRWSLEGVVEPILRLTDESVKPPREGGAGESGAGAGGTRRMRFTAEQFGDADLRLALFRPWKGTDSVSRRFRVQVEVRSVAGAARPPPSPW
jgi:inhibitor of cysteine peptidase